MGYKNTSLRRDELQLRRVKDFPLEMNFISERHGHWGMHSITLLVMMNRMGVEVIPAHFKWSWIGSYISDKHGSGHPIVFLFTTDSFMMVSEPLMFMNYLVAKEFFFFFGSVRKSYSVWGIIFLMTVQQGRSLWVFMGLQFLGCHGIDRREFLLC